MSSVPDSLDRYLSGQLHEERSPAWIVVARDGRIVRAGGALERYQIAALQAGQHVEHELSFLTGMLPLSGPLKLPCVVTDSGAVVELHAFVEDGEDWVVLLDASRFMSDQQRLQRAEHELELLQRRAPRELTSRTAEVKELLSELLQTLDTVVLERNADGKFALIGNPPDWVLRLCPGAEPERFVRPASYSAFLEYFLVDAEALWERRGIDRLQSGPWTETDSHGEIHHLEAIAIARDDLALLLITTLGSTYQQRQDLVQKSRELSLQYQSDLSAQRTAVDSLRRERDTAEEAARTMSEFLSRTSHELRTPLNSVIGFANVLLRNQKGHLDPQETVYLRRILDNGVHLLALINDLLDLSRLEAHRMDVELSTFDIVELVRETIGQLEPQSSEKGIELTVELPSTTAPIDSDRRRMKQILINLIGNAIKFTDEGRVTVGVRVDDGVATSIEVADTGPGIPVEDRARVFEAFHQSDSGGKKHKGTGLGLAITHGLLAVLGYTIELESELGQGTTFRIQLAPEAPPGREPRAARA